MKRLTKSQYEAIAAQMRASHPRRYSSAPPEDPKEFEVWEKNYGEAWQAHMYQWTKGLFALGEEFAKYDDKFDEDKFYKLSGI